MSRKCVICKTKASSYNYPGDPAKYCNDHKLENMINVIGLKCLECKIKQASYNLIGEKKPEFCKDCAIGKNMVDVRNCLCVSCNSKRPSFNLPGEPKALYCKDCKSSEMVLTKVKKCLSCNEKQPIFNYKGEKALFCKGCAKEGMVDVKNKMCEKCHIIRATYTLDGIKDSSGKFCKSCAKKVSKEIEATEPSQKVTIVDFSNKMCEKCGSKRASYGDKNSKVSSFCKECSDENMTLIGIEKCKGEGCSKIPHFNYTGQKALYCKTCSLSGMVDVKTKMCIKCGVKQPYYNTEEYKKGLYCKKCSDSTMVNVKDRKCHCGSRATFGYIGQSSEVCAKHKKSLMFIKRFTKCEKCDVIASYGLDKPLRCYLHKIDDDMNLAGQNCTKCKAEKELCDKNGLCYMCSPEKQNFVIEKHRKVKEHETLSYLDEHINLPVLLDDRIIDTLCSKVRPDRVYDCGSFFIIIEVDEFQHKSYYNNCVFSRDIQSVRRMVQISEALSMCQLPCFFIRFNPDTFKVDGKTRKVSKLEKFRVLENTIKQCLQSKVDLDTPSIQIKYLFFDNYSPLDGFETITCEEDLVTAK